MVKENDFQFAERVKDCLKKIPKGRVTTYGRVAAMAGNPFGARQVVWILHASAEKEALPWFRVVNSRGTISLPPGNGYELQKALLQKEGIDFDAQDCIDFEKYLWHPANVRVEL